MGDEKEEVIVGSPDIHYEPVVKLQEVAVKTLEEKEEELLKMRAKLYRFTIDDEDGAQWKERGTGEVKILCRKETGVTRLLMRREKTLKICANHMLIKGIELKPHGKSDRAFIWVTEADFADEESKRETLAIRLPTKEAAELFKVAFEKAVDADVKSATIANNLGEKLAELSVSDAKEKEDAKTKGEEDGPTKSKEDASEKQSDGNDTTPKTSTDNDAKQEDRTEQSNDAKAEKK